MPWLTIIMALLSFFASKQSGASNTKALAMAGLAGAGTYAVTHNTDWGAANLGSLDGVTSTTSAATVLVGSDGQPVLDAAGNPVPAPSLITGLGSTVADTLKSWGGVGTAAVVGTVAASSSGLFSSANLPWIIGGVALVFLMK